MKIPTYTLCLLTVLCIAASGCGSDKTGETQEKPAVTTIRETTIVERTIVKTVTEEPEESEEPETIETRNDDTSPESENRLSNDSNAISAEVPANWDDRRTDEVWELDGEAVGPAFTATTDLYGWEESGLASAGTFITASESLAKSATDDEILDSPGVDFSGNCTLLEREDFQSHGYEGRIQGGENCESGGKSLFNVVASKEGRGCIVMVQVGYTTDEERREAERVLDTFEADCDRVAEFEEGLEDYVVEEPSPEPATPAASCGGFASQFGAQQYYTGVATPEEQAALDPDGNGFACDIELLGYQLPGPLDGVCQGEGEGDPDCAAAMREAMENNPENGGPPTNYVTPDDGNPNTLENTCEGIIAQEDYEECVAQQQAAGNPNYTD